MYLSNSAMYKEIKEAHRHASWNQSIYYNRWLIKKIKKYGKWSHVQRLKGIRSEQDKEILIQSALDDKFSTMHG